MGRKVRLITCLCWDDPYIDGNREDITDYILKAEQRRGNDTSNAKVVVEVAFSKDLPFPTGKKSYIWESLRSIYDEYYDESQLSRYIHDFTVPREVRHKDGHVLVRYFVLYADKSDESECFW